jgi:hypothetical protein
MENTIILRVQDLARGGAGVSRDSEGRVIFVPYTAPGDLVRVQVIEENKRYAEAVLLEVLEPSPLRQTPRCPAFGQCGGCQWQHLPYEVQWKTKSQGVLQALQRLQVKAPESLDFLQADRVWEYRNRVQLRGFRGELGFFQAGTKNLVPVNRCDLARAEINENWEQVRKDGEGFSRPYKVELEVLESGELSRVWNAGHSARGFRQVHDEQNEKLRGWITEVVPVSVLLFDLFGGSGNLSLPLMSKAQEIHCVDLSVPHLRPPELPAHFRFHRSSVLPWLLRQKSVDFSTAGTRRGYVTAILDPPRVGLAQDFSEIAGALEGLGVQTLVSVGCDPDAWCRDLSRWIKRGWKFEKMMVIDLFPQTAHVESVGYLTRFS